MKGRTFAGEDGLHTASSSEAISDDPFFEFEHNIFLSHSGAQKEFVDHLCKALEDRFRYPFYDKRHESLPKGEEFLGLIFKAVQQCQVFVVVISEEFFMSKWPMIELNAFVKSMKSTYNQRILPLFYGLSPGDLKDEERRLRWFEEWEAFAKADPRGLIKVDDWKYAVDQLRMFNGLSYDRFSGILAYESRIVSHICELVTVDIQWKDSHVQGNAHKVKHISIVSPSHSLFREGVKGRAFVGKDDLHTAIDPRSRASVSDDPFVELEHKIFLSHSGAQKEFADHLCKALEDRFHYPFYDKRHESLPKGEEFLGLIFKAVQQCQVFVVVISEEFFMSKWPMIELNAFVKSMKSTYNQRILPLFYGLSPGDLKDEERRLRWFEEWEAFAKADPRGLIKVDDWKYAVDQLRMFNGLSYDRFSGILAYESRIVSHICELVTVDIQWKDSHVQGNAHKVKHISIVSPSHSLFREGVKGRAFVGKDDLHTAIDPRSRASVSDDPFVELEHKIFLSHSGAQKEFADHLCKALEDRFHYPFYDKRHESLPKGEEFLGLIFKAVQQCQVFVVVISEEFFMSKWPMIELNAFVKSMKSTYNQRILPLFYGLSPGDLKDEERRLRWFEEWEAFAKADPRGLIKVDDWKYAVDQLRMFNGLSYDRFSGILAYESRIVSHICELITPLMLMEAVTEFARLSDTSLLTFPAGDPNPVRIDDEDLQSLQPKRHLSINIIDFYMKYLEKEVFSFRDKDRFFFFNCSFFISIFGTKTTSTDIDYEQAWQWIRGVNLFEKDYIFIPVHKSEHWSLVIIYHLNSLTGSPTDVHYRSPCIFHVDSVEGKHDDLEGDIRGFIFKSWTEIHHNSDILQALFHMKYVEAKVPQGDNGYDSGIYLLHYVELFILESASRDFSFGTEQGKSYFPGWDTSEVVTKRKHIQNLILKLSRMTQLQGTLRLHSSDIISWLRFRAASEGRITDVQNSDLTMVNGKGAESEHGGYQTGGVTVINDPQPIDVAQSLRLLREDTRLREYEASRRPETEEISSPRVDAEESSPQADSDTPNLGKESENRRSRKWSAVETSVLLRCIVGYDWLSQRNNATRWDLVAGEVNRVCGTTHGKYQCRWRFDTLCKAFKQVEKFSGATAIDFFEMTSEERHQIKLATTLTREWYTLMGEYYTSRFNQRNGGKRPFDYPSRSAADIQIGAPADCPSSPRIDTGKLLSRSAGEFQSEILPEPPPASPNDRNDGNPVPESSLTTDPRPLVQRRKSRSDEDEMKGVYRRAVKVKDNRSSRFRYEPRFKPPRDINPLGEPVKFKMLSLGGYRTLQDAKDVRQIAAYYYGRSDAWLDLGDGTLFRIPDCDPVESQSLRGEDKRLWVQRKAKEVFTAFQMEKARRDLFRKEERLSPANPNPEPFMAT